MVTFSHLDESVSEEAWASVLHGLPGLDLDLLFPGGQGRLVVLAAHPDDETLGAGGLIAAVAARGLAVDVVVATAGEASHPDSTTITPAVLARIREREVRDAVAHLAPNASVHFLGLPDGALSRHRGELDAALADIAGTSETPTVLVAPWRQDGHTDHDTAGLAAAGLARIRGLALLEYPIWLWHWGTARDLPEELHLFPIGFQPGVGGPEAGDPDTGGTPRAAKERAMAAHQTQVMPLSALPGDEALLSPAVLEHFQRPFEAFVLTRPQAPRQVFDDLYRESEDPWGFESSFYEQRKRALCLAMLPRPRFSSVFEPGCSIGVFTADLAARADAVLATDISARALELAGKRLAGVPQVRLDRGSVPEDWPEGKFDLVVVSEIGYFLQPGGLLGLADRAAGSLADDGVLLLCHWRHPNQGWELTGDQVHEAFRSRPELRLFAEHCEEDFRIDVLIRSTPSSAATSLAATPSGPA